MRNNIMVNLNKNKMILSIEYDRTQPAFWKLLR